MRSYEILGAHFPELSCQSKNGEEATTERNEVFNTNQIPWFVSDVVPRDLEDLLGILEDPHFKVDESTAARQLEKLAARWRQHFAAGTFKFSCPQESHLGKGSELDQFWTGPLALHHLPTHGVDTVRELSQSDLVIFKVGVLQFRAD